MQLCGAKVSEDDCRTLVDLLSRVGRADNLELAGRIDQGIEHETVILELSPAECETLRGVLDDPPEGSLAQLRDRLLKKHEARRSRVVQIRDHNFKLIETRYGARTPVNEPEPVERCAICGAELTDDSTAITLIDTQAGGHRIYHRSCAACDHEIDTFRQGLGRLPPPLSLSTIPRSRTRSRTNQRLRNLRPCGILRCLRYSSGDFAGSLW